ncbi:hypothetical protein K2D_15930 [Planctomycetes bacterium K2D]|uniref:Uncharacterized protein n=1 Tax=Botrimarina mediterranea TaxID=2528022 RepID=A0A518K6Q0_9BACT|nr:hypothetical protein Spa11_16670 [Botrimarina mediterranea]QDV77988.1 hypothetical protein K2D_15930 [Planctomycetes bacterium K2D]
MVHPGACRCSASKLQGLFGPECHAPTINLLLTTTPAASLAKAFYKAIAPVTRLDLNVTLRQ